MKECMTALSQVYFFCLSLGLFGFPNQTVDQEEMRFYGKSYSCTKGMWFNLILAADKGSPEVHIGDMLPQTPGACPVPSYSL